MRNPARRTKGASIIAVQRPRGQLMACLQAAAGRHLKPLARLERQAEIDVHVFIRKLLVLTSENDDAFAASSFAISYACLCSSSC